MAVLVVGCEFLYSCPPLFSIFVVIQLFAYKLLLASSNHLLNRRLELLVTRTAFVVCFVPGCDGFLNVCSYPGRLVL